MAAADTNVLVRLIVRDDEVQTARADAFIARGGIWISHVVLVETIWVLRSIYRFDHAQLVTVVQMLLDLGNIIIDDAEVVAAALEQYRREPAIGFADCLILELARTAGQLPLGTLDNGLGRLEGATRL